MGNDKSQEEAPVSQGPSPDDQSTRVTDADGDGIAENAVGIIEPNARPSTPVAAPDDAPPPLRDSATETATEGEPPASSAATPSAAKQRPRKRKLDDSPPWKSAKAEVPTTIFTNDGRRRSGRANPIVADLMPPPQMNGGTPTRPKTSGRPFKGDVSSSTPAPAGSVRSRSRSQSQSSKKARTSSPSRSTSRSAKASTSSSARAASGTKSPLTTKKTSSHRSSSSSKLPVASKTTPTKKRGTASRPLRSPVTAGTRQSSRALQKALAEAKEDLRARRDLSDDDESPLSEFSTDGEGDVDGTAIPKVKLRLKFENVIVHPAQVLPKPEFASFEEFLSHDDPMRDEAKRKEMEEAAWKEAEARNRIDYEARHGLLTEDNCSLFLPDKLPEPDRQYGHQDHLVSHALRFHKLMMKEKREHQDLMRRRNAAVMAEIKLRTPRTQEEIEQEQFDTSRRRFKDQIAQLRRKWDEVAKEVEKRRIQRAEEERRQAGKEHLHQMLEHSTQLLVNRHADADRPESVLSNEELDMEDFSGDGEEFEDELDEAPSDVPDDANMSSSESDPDPDPEDEDANLTVEELRAKYSGIPATPSPLDDADTPLDFDDDEEVQTDVDMEDEAPPPPLDEVDDALLDDSDESVDMDSDMSDEEDDDEEDEDDESEEEDSGLLGFYGGLGGLTGASTAAESANEDDEEEQPDDGYNDEEDDDDLDVVDLVGVPKPPIRTHSIPSTPRIPPSVKEEETEDDGSTMQVVDDVPLQAEPPVPTPAEPEVTTESTPEEPSETVPADDPMDIDQSAAPRIVELEDDGVTEKPQEDESVQPSKTESVDDTITTMSQVDPKDTAAHSSPTTSPETTPQPHNEIKTPVPFLLRGTLREYQHYGLEWLAGLYDNHTNGILADEMGLGKTIQTIALISHLACEKGIWGPHLIVVPTSVMLNWEMEFKKWAPGFKILTYYGTREQRAEKRKGWYDTNLWHVCITSYQLVLQDQVTFKRRNWHYLILDEAHNIKNFRSQRWQTLLNFKSEARLLLTGTPLQNNLIELWSLLYFLMPAGTTSLPAGFANLQEFQEWFAHPVDQLIEGGREGMDDEAKRTVTKLHKVLRPYLLRRLKADVEKQMPGKYEHIVYCRLSKRQRYLYDDFMSMAKTRETLASGNYLSIINCLMQLRKVCNHPDLFETRQITTSFAMSRSVVASYENKELMLRKRLMNSDLSDPSFGTSFLEFLGLVPAKHNHSTTHQTRAISVLSATDLIRQYHAEKARALEPADEDLITLHGNLRYQKYRSDLEALNRVESRARLNNIITRYSPLIPSDIVEICSRDISIGPLRKPPRKRAQFMDWFMKSSTLISSMIPTRSERAAELETTIIKFGCVTPAVVATDMPEIALTPKGVQIMRRCQIEYPDDPYHQARIRLSIQFPDKRLLQYDCGKLQRLAVLLRELQAGGHRALIFTQMTKVLDILEQFLNIHGHRYLRLDGATKVEQRQALTDRFNNDPRIPVFILSTRSGGLGINLTGADTVIFYDLDWNPAMDKQCQDRCHRIGQTRDVHIYRFVSEFTIESNILRKSEQKRMLDDVIIQEGDFTTDYFHKLSIADMLGEDVVRDLKVDDLKNKPIVPTATADIGKTLEQVEDIEDAAAAKVAQREVADTDVADFEEASRVAEAAEKQPRERERKKAQPIPLQVQVDQTPTAAPATPVTPMDVDTPVPQVEDAETPAVEEESEAKAEDDIWNRTGLGHDIYGEGWGRVDREPEHVDEFMIRHMEWELADVAVVLPNERRKKRNKKGKKF